MKSLIIIFLFISISIFAQKIPPDIQYQFIPLKDQNGKLITSIGNIDYYGKISTKLFYYGYIQKYVDGKKEDQKIGFQVLGFFIMFTDQAFKDFKYNRKKSMFDYTLYHQMPGFIDKINEFTMHRNFSDGILGGRIYINTWNETEWFSYLIYKE